MKYLLPLVLISLLPACGRDAPAPVAVPAEAPVTAPPAAPVAPPVTQGAPGQVPRAFLCRGNEPFWSLDVRADGAFLKTPESESALDGELRGNGSGAFQFRGAPDGGPLDGVEALISPAQCFDSMADGPALPFSVQVSLPGGRVGSGCCSAEYGIDLASAPAFDASNKMEGDWSRFLPDLADAVRHCVGDAGVATDVVTSARPLPQGKAEVRLRDTGNARFDCLVDVESGKIDDVRAVPEGDRQPGEGQPVWIPLGDGPPVLGCGRAERVMVGGDALVGYLYYSEGCD